MNGEIFVFIEHVASPVCQVLSLLRREILIILVVLLSDNGEVSLTIRALLSKLDFLG